MVVLVLFASPAYAGDSDGDGVDDAFDNCIEAANADQRDTNGDGYGNACDADIDDDGIVNSADLALIKAAFFTQTGKPGYDQDTDLDGDGRINFGDLAIMKASFLSAPGPSSFPSFAPAGNTDEIAGHVKEALEEVKDFVLVRIDTGDLLGRIGAGQSAFVPLVNPDHEWSPVPLSLFPDSPRGPDFKALMVIDEGVAEPVPDFDEHIFGGTMLHDLKAPAVFSILPGALQGYLLSEAHRWTFVEPIEPLLARVGLTQAEIDAALAIADHVAYNMVDVAAQFFHEEEDEGGETILEVEPPPDVGATLIVSLWANEPYVQRFGGDGVLTLYQMELAFAGVDNVVQFIAPLLSESGFTIDIDIAQMVFNTQPGQCPIGPNSGAVNIASQTCPHPFAEPDLVHVFAGESSDGSGFIRGLIKLPEHKNHATSGYRGSLAGRLGMALHEFGHNIGAVHGSSDSDWAAAVDEFLVGDFNRTESGDLSLGRSDIITGQLVGGGYRWWNGRVTPDYYSPESGVQIVYGLAQMRPGYLDHDPGTNAAPVLIGAPGDTFRGGEFSGDQRRDLLIASLFAPETYLLEVAEHESGVDPNDRFETPIGWGAIVASDGELILAGDFTGDGTDDVAGGRVLDATTIEWTVAESLGNAFAPGVGFSADVGDDGDVFMTGDFNFDLADDLLMLRTLSPTQVMALIAVSFGTNFQPPFVAAVDAGDDGDEFLVGDYTGDGRADLLVGHALADDSMTWALWEGQPAGGLVFLGTFGALGEAGDFFFAADIDANGTADLLRGWLPTLRTAGGMLRWEGAFSSGVFLTAPERLAGDLCVTDLVCGSGIMLMSYYAGGYDARIVPAFSAANARAIQTVLSVFNAGP